MKRFIVRCFATAEIGADNEEHAHQILKALSEKSNHQVALFSNLQSQGGYVFAMVTVDDRADLECAGDIF